jgi:hypothetical protein
MSIKRSKGIKCEICNTIEVLGTHNRVCLGCYFQHDEKIPKYIPFEQHDLWIIKYTRKE